MTLFCVRQDRLLLVCVCVCVCVGSPIYIRRNVNLSHMFGKIVLKTLNFCFAILRLVTFNHGNEFVTIIWNKISSCKKLQVL